MRCGKQPGDYNRHLGVLGRGMCVWRALGPREMKGDPCIEGLKLLGAPGKRMDL